jgi:hypothetical protein
MNGKTGFQAGKDYADSPNNALNASIGCKNFIPFKIVLLFFFSLKFVPGVLLRI